MIVPPSPPLQNVADGNGQFIWSITVKVDDRWVRVVNQGRFLFKLAADVIESREGKSATQLRFSLSQCKP